MHAALLHEHAHAGGLAEHEAARVARDRRARHLRELLVAHDARVARPVRRVGGGHGEQGLEPGEQRGRAGGGVNSHRPPILRQGGASAERVPGGGFTGEAFNFGTETPLSVLEVVDRLLREMGRTDLAPVVGQQVTLVLRQRRP